MREVRSVFTSMIRPIVCCFGLGVIVAGCAQTAPTTQPTTRPSTLRERQDAAMRDPFGYSPDAGNADISGGGLTDFDRQGFNRDFKDVLNP
jgi:hypothetical protein